jgi:hypothetical protein
MLNLIQKLHCLMLCESVNVWHFPCAKDRPAFVYWLTSEPQNKDGYGFNTFEEMIEAAYAHIDPLLRPTPETIEAPPQAMDVA